MANDFLERTAEIFSLPDEALGASHIEISGTREVIIENHKGILEYDESHVLLAAKRHTIKVCGESLNIDAMNEIGIRISGKIGSVCFGGE